MRLPTDDEINSAAKQLGLADDNGVCPPSLRSRVAKTLLEAVAEDGRQAARAAGIASVVADIADMHQRLVDAIGTKAATAATAALAPVIYQSAHPERIDDATPSGRDQPR
ncbi:hypothetical protein [Nocardia neocaledoniensis]|uniref:hypothetical protein n=1 Tax=Nocardia neocaledoniensis TaxID=236511 RepID=UPI002455D248|nr:hypothetical protein [Nocardia neocaledoniensis]